MWFVFGLKLIEARGVNALSVRRPSKFEVTDKPEFGKGVPVWSNGGRAAELRRAAEDEVLPEHARMALVVGVAAAERHAPLRREVVGEIAEDRPGLGVDVAARRRGQARQEQRVAGVQADVEHVEGVGVQIIEAGDALQRALVGNELEFLAELVVPVDRRHVDVDERQRVEVDRRVGLCPCDRR